MKNLIIETTSRCNLSCVMCARQTWTDATGDMSKETFEQLTPAFSNLKSVNLTGYGEPLLNPYLPDMIRIARKHLPGDSRIELTSNGILIDETVAEELMEGGLDGISLSIDSIDSDRFRGIRGNGALHTVLNCLDTFVELRKKREKSFRITISFVAMQSNIRELPHLVQFVADRQVDALWVNNVLPPTEEMSREVLYGRYSDEVLILFAQVQDRLSGLGLDLQIFPLLIQKLCRSSCCGFASTESLSWEERQALQYSKETVRKALAIGGDFPLLQLLSEDQSKFEEQLKIFEKSRELAASHNLELHLPLIIPKTRRECAFVKNETCFISSNGWVRPCNQLSHDYLCFHHGRLKRVDSVSFGNITEKDLGTIWESEPYRSFRKSVEEFPFAPCSECAVAECCSYISPDEAFVSDCYLNEQPCGDCLWSQGILQCP